MTWVYVLHRADRFVGVFSSLEAAQQCYPGKWEEYPNGLGGLRAPDAWHMGDAQIRQELLRTEPLLF